ncbi:MAG: amidase family protein, partial [Pseudomonadota bacterium]
MSDLWKLTAVEIADLVASKKVTATEVTQSALGRLEAVNSRINAVVQHMPDEALATARQIDEKIARNEPVGLMAGVPVTTKVNVDQSGFATTNGLRLQENLIAEQDNPVVANLKNADAVI